MCVSQTAQVRESLDNALSVGHEVLLDFIYFLSDPNGDNPESEDLIDRNRSFSHSRIFFKPQNI